MARVKFTAALSRFFPTLKSVEVEGTTIAEIVDNVDKQHIGIADYLVDESGALRKHVNIYIGEDLIIDRKTLQDSVKVEDEILIFQALSGG